MDANSQELTTIEKMKGLPWAIVFNVANSVFVQLTFFGSVFVLFLDELNFNNTQIGILLGLIHFTGVFSIFIAHVPERLGYKRTQLIFMGLRTVASMFLLLTPLVVARYDLPNIFLFITITTGAFAFFRTISLSGWLPWAQEYIPDSVRGKFSAINNIFTSLFAFLAVTIAGWVLGKVLPLTNFMILIGAGGLFGALSVWTATFIPGGKPQLKSKAQKSQKEVYKGILEAIRDKGYVFMLIGVGILTLGTSPMNSFIPIFMSDTIKLTTEQVVYLSSISMLGGIISSYVWGWAADRYGSKPVTLTGVILRLILPVLYFLTPHESGFSFSFALLVSFFAGVANMGWTIGSNNLLYVGMVPAEKSNAYMTVWNAWGGLTWGLAQPLGGWLLDRFAPINVSFLGIPVDAFSIVFLLAFVTSILSLLLINFIKAEDDVSMGEFVSLFTHGNPITAVNSMIRFRLAKDEKTIINVTEQLGISNSPLTVEELLQALADPRFNVRFEALISIARHSPDSKLSHALAAVLERGEPALGVVAAWALGRIGDEDSIGALRHSLEKAPYRSIQAHCARALGTLNDKQSIPFLLENLGKESDRGLRIAYASALGQMRSTEAVPEIFKLLDETKDKYLQTEIALALARIAGDEHPFIQLVRSTREDTGTSASQAVSGAQKKIDDFLLTHGLYKTYSDLDRLLGKSAEALSRCDLDGGINFWVQALEQLPQNQFGENSRYLIPPCLEKMKTYRSERIEYFLLSLQAINFFGS
ncbi:MAG: MFS transporter [Anaerolineales bacterium]|nr:MFS transporter [Anaerolineales bacterium]